MDLSNRLREFIETHSLLSPAETVIVGYSGGIDSTALLVLLKESGFDAIAAHLNHGQRETAERETLLCQAFAEDLDIPFVAGKANVPAMAEAMKVGLEEAGRHARYEFLRQCSIRLEGKKVATAHNQNDLVETMLFNLARGTGLAGLAGIPVERDGIIRPLLWANRIELQQFVTERGYWTCHDPSNDDEAFSRVRTRKRLIPEFLTLHDSAITNAARTAGIVADENRLLDALATSLIQSSEIEDTHPLAFVAKFASLNLDATKLRHSPVALVRRVFRLCAEALGGSLTWDQTNSLCNLLTQQEKGSITLEGIDGVIEVSPISVSARRLSQAISYRQPLTVPGETLSDEFGWQFVAFETTDSPQREPKSLEVVVDAAKLKGTPYIRPFEPGDRMQPFGSAGDKKLQDLLTDAKVDSEVKERLPIVCDMVGPIWVPGVCLNERLRVTEVTERRLCLRFGPVSADASV